jgi:hypothetical protein
MVSFYFYVFSTCLVSVLHVVLLGFCVGFSVRYF